MRVTSVLQPQIKSDSLKLSELKTKVDIPIRMQRSGLSPEETREIISSKIENVFANGVQNSRLRFIKDEVIKCLSYSITVNGLMDRRRCSPKVWQDLGIIPAPEKENEYKIPNTQAYIHMVNQTKHDAMLRLFNIMTSDQFQLLDEIDVFDRQQDWAIGLSDVELCRVIDNATHVIAEWYRARAGLYVYTSYLLITRNV